MKRLRGKTALITGASRGIGAAIARRFAGEGADIAITYLGSQSQAEAVVAAAEESGAMAVAIRADSGDPRAVRAAVAEAHEALGRLDILVNNAGIFARRPLHETDDEDFERVMAVNVRAVYAAIKEAVPLMDRGGRIINMTSSFAARVPFPGIGLYAASKAAVAGLTRAYARDLAVLGITVNAIQPGPIATDMNPDDGRHARIMAMMTALGRYGAPEDVAAMAAFLASDDADYVTGAILNVDGGLET